MLNGLVINERYYGAVDSYHQDRTRRNWIFNLIGGAVVTVPFDAIHYWGYSVIGHDITLYDGRQPVFEYAAK